MPENVNIMLLRLQTLIFLQRMLIFVFFKQAINLVVLKIQTLFFDSSNFCSIILSLDVMLGVFLSHVQFRGHPSRYLSRAYTQSLVLSFSDSLLSRIFLFTFLQQWLHQAYPLVLQARRKWRVPLGFQLPDMVQAVACPQARCHENGHSPSAVPFFQVSTTPHSLPIQYLQIVIFGILSRVFNCHV